MVPLQEVYHQVMKVLVGVSYSIDLKPVLVMEIILQVMMKVPS